MPEKLGLYFRDCLVIQTHKRKLSSNAGQVAEDAVARHMALRAAFTEKRDTVSSGICEARRLMSAAGGAIREPKAMASALARTREALSRWAEETGVETPDRLITAYQYRDALVCQLVCLSAMLDYSNTLGRTRGSALYYQKEGMLREGLAETFRFVGGPKAGADRIQQGILEGDTCRFIWRPVRPMPEDGDFFEHVRRRYRENTWMDEEETQ